MSENINCGNSQLDADTIRKISCLSKLRFDEPQACEIAQGLNKILQMMDTLSQFNTDDVEPLKNPFDTAQPLRTDIVTECDNRTAYQAIAPATQAGLYLVPRVIE